MNAILGMTYLVQRTELTSKQKDYIDKIASSGQHLLGIINDILDFSKIEAGKLTLEETDFCLNDVLENLSTLIAEKCSAKGLELIFEIDPDVPIYLRGDPLRLGQVLVNYTNNAVKFTEKGEIIVRVSQNAIQDGKVQLRFEVQDTGIGLLPEQKDRLFKSFQQADTSTTRKYGGTGLGLAISRQLSEMMGGEVGVESEYGRGSTFWFTAWLMIGQQKPQERVSDLKLNGRRVLLVDDNRQARLILSEMLRLMHLRPDEAASGETAVEMVLSACAANDPYELIYMDYQMPGVSGVQAFARIQALHLADSPRCIIITGFGREDVLLEARNAGIEMVLVKPVTPSVLFEATLHSLLGPAAIGSLPQIRQQTATDHRQLMRSIRGARILLVEDNELNRQVALEILEEGLFKIDVAVNGEIAVAKVLAKPFDLVLMDMQMPVMDGLEATRQIRTHGQFASLPILALTANAMAGDLDRCISAGMNDLVTKPIDPDQLFAKLVRWIPPTPEGQMAMVPPDIASAQQANGQARTEAMPELNIQGLDVQAGLKRVLNKPKSYISLLRKFATGQAGAITEIQAFLAAGDAAGAQRTAHTLKGLAGSIGATTLQGAAAELEQAIREALGEDQLSTLLERTQLLLETLIQALRANLPAEVTKTIPLGPVTPAAQLHKFLADLSPSLVARKPKKCAEILAANQTLIWPADLQPDAAALELATTKYKFKEALELVHSLEARLMEGAE